MVYDFTKCANLIMGEGFKLVREYFLNAFYVVYQYILVAYGYRDDVIGRQIRDDA